MREDEKGSNKMVDAIEDGRMFGEDANVKERFCGRSRRIRKDLGL